MTIRRSTIGCPSWTDITPKGDKGSSAALYGYAAAETLAQALKQCGDDLSRENVMRPSRIFSPPFFLPGIKINTVPDDFRPIKQMRLIQVDGRIWQQIGDVIETTFSDTHADMNERLRICRTIKYDPPSAKISFANLRPAAE